MNKKTNLLLAFLSYSMIAFSQTFTMQSFDGSVTCGFGSLPYRVYYPQELTGTACVIHVSRGGNGLGDDRGQLLSYVQRYVQEGYVVVQVDHRFAGNDVPLIAQYRGEEIKCIASKVTDGTLSYGNFRGTIDRNRQGFAGHSGGCMEGLEAAGTGMTHGNYLVPQIKAVYGMSPAGFQPDQFGITVNPSGFSRIDSAAVFVIIGEQEKDVNGGGMFMSTDWRFQTYTSMNTIAPRYQAFVRGQNTEHNDVAGQNADIQKYNNDNSVALFDTYLKRRNRAAEIGRLSLPPNNPITFSQKGTGTTAINSLLVNEIGVFPNPFTGKITLKNGQGDENFMLTNAIGQTVYLGKNIMEHDFSHLNKGIYFLTIRGFSQKETPQYFKLLKQ